MLRRNGPVIRLMESVQRPEGSLWWEGFVKEVGFEPGVKESELWAETLKPRGQTGFEAKNLASALASSSWPRPQETLASAFRFWPRPRITI